MEGNDGWLIKKKLDIAEAKRIRKNEAERRKNLLKVGAGTGAIMAGDLNRKDGFLAEIEGPSWLIKRKKDCNAYDSDATASVSEEILFHQADGPNTSCFSALELSHQRTSRLRSEILRSQIKECEAEFKKSECFAQDIDDDDNISVCKQDKKWSSRQQVIDEDFNNCRDDFFNSFI